jgi:aspartate/methionine/tyrosine aminotransferase
MGSPYMQWAKGHAHVPYNLASSGMTNYPLSDLPVTLDSLEITGDSYYGYPPLLRALSGHCGVPTEQIFTTIGTSMANFVAFAALLQPGDEVLIEQPTYELLLSAAHYLQLHVRRFRRDEANGFLLDPAEIGRAITQKTRAIVVTNLHNPSSAFTDEDTMRAVGAIARERGAHVIVDEVYLDGAWERPHRTAVHWGKEFVVTNSLTKICGLSGLRCGWVLAQPELIQKMWHLADMMYGIPAHPSERMAVAALEHLPAIHRRSRAILDSNHAAFRRFLGGREDLQLVYHGMGTVAFPKLTSGDVGRLYGILTDRYEAAIAPGKFFEMPEYFRIGLGGKPEVFEAGLHRLGSALADMAAG